MRKDLGVKGAIYPEPVLILSTYNEDGSVDAMNAAWGCVIDSDKIGIVLSHDHKTTANILRRKAVIVSFGTKKTVAACDYVGIVSGNTEPHKFEKSGFHSLPSKCVDAPLIEELPLALECEFERYEEDKELMVLTIKNASADDAILSSDGKIDIAKLEPISFDGFNNRYVLLKGEVAPAFKIGLSLKK